MNKRIRALWDLSRNKSGRGHDEEKFAELIVRECIDWCNAYASVDGTAQKIVESIKKDFGVNNDKL